MAWLDRARHARQHKKQQTTSRLLRASKARQMKVVDSSQNHQWRLMIANQRKRIKQLETANKALKSQVTKLSNQAKRNARNQSSMSLSDIFCELKRIMNDMQVVAGQHNYDRLVCLYNAAYVTFVSDLYVLCVTACPEISNINSVY